MKKILSGLLVTLVFTHLNAQHLADTLPHQRKALIETFTGAKCGNCPVALRTADTVRAHHPSQVSLLSIHSGFYANTNSTYTLDLKTTWGETEDTYYGASANGIPAGLVNRETFSGNSPILQYTSYDASVQSILASGNSPVNIGVNPSYNLSTQTINVDVELYFRSTIAGGVLNVVLAEDSIWGNQLDYTLPSGNQVCYCKHNHVLRYSFTNQWDGNVVSPASCSAGNYFSQSYSYNIPSNININNCYVIAYVSDTTSGRVVYTTETHDLSFTGDIAGNEPQNFVVYPNPGNDEMYFVAPEEGLLSIYSSIGEKIFTSKVLAGNDKIDIGALSSGLYFIEYATGSKKRGAKFIKQ